MFSRRRILQGGCGLGAGIAAGLPRIGHAYAVPQTENKVLEVFHRGGMSPWRSFFYEPAFAGLESPAPDWTEFSPVPTTATLTWMHGDTLGESAYPLYGAGLMDRCRVVILEHDLIPHEAAVPFALTGTRLGRPKFAGLGAAVNAHHGDPLAAIILDTGDSMAAGHASSTGSYGAENRPMVVRMGDSSLLDALQRSDTSHTDGIKRVLLDRYAEGLVHPTGGAVRSAGFEAYDAAMTGLMENASELRDLLLATSYGAAVTGDWESNLTRQALRVAAELLASGRVRYVCVIDTGVEDSYDTHDKAGANQNQAGNLWSVCDELGLLATGPEGLLDDVTVALNTEFGRLQTSGSADGTEHWPYGYCGVILSPHYTNARQRGGIDAGGFAEPGSQGRGPYNPTDLRAALAYRAGVTVEDLIDVGELSHPNDLPTILDELL